MTQLSVNIDHVATVRQARRASYPDPVEAAAAAEAAGASGITAHLRGDRRHVQDDDIEVLSRSVKGKLNVEMAPTDEMVAIACRIAPDQVTLVPERPEEVTTEGGLDLASQGLRVVAAARRLRETGIDVSVFLDPSVDQVERVAELGDGLVSGFEINTDAYTRADDEEAASYLETMTRVARRGEELGLRVYAGHGLTASNVAPVAAIPQVEELNIGHWLVARSIILGIDGAVREMLQAMGR